MYVCAFLVLTGYENLNRFLPENLPFALRLSSPKDHQEYLQLTDTIDKKALFLLINLH